MTTEAYLSKPYLNEDQMTADTYQWVYNNFPPLRNFFFHIANELSKTEKESAGSFAARLTRHMSCGCLPGVYDFEAKKPYTWYLELKMPGKTFSASQRKLYDIWTPEGIQIELADTKQKVVAALMKHCGEMYVPIVRGK